MPLDGLGMNFFCVDILDLETQLGERGEGNLIAPRYSPAASIRFRRTGEEAMVALEELLWFGRSGVRIGWNPTSSSEGGSSELTSAYAEVEFALFVI